MKKCKVCGKLFRLKKENKYLVETVSQNVIFKASENKTVYECFDCPACGCQNVCNVREVCVVNTINEGGETNANQ